jgi:hypothetical protein
MSPRIPRLLGTLLLLGPVAGVAQEPSGRAPLDSALARIFRLPRTTTEAREKGVPDSQVGSIIDILRRGNVPAADAQEILDAEVRATAEGRSTGNFGEFVQAQHRAGLRGRALADAIHREQVRRGMGRGTGRGQERARPNGDDRDDGRAPGARGGRLDTAGPATPRVRGRPDSAAKPGARGRPESAATPRVRGRADTATSRTPPQERRP